MMTQPAAETCLAQARSSSCLTRSSGTLIRCEASSTTSKRSSSARSSILAQTVSAVVMCASISGDSSTATTRWPSAVSAPVTRPVPAPSSRIEAAGWPAAAWTISGSRPGDSIA